MRPSSERIVCQPSAVATVITALSWVDVDPQTHPVDWADVERIVRDQIPSNWAGNKSLQSVRLGLERRISRALLAEIGAWIDGWSWAASEPGGGGPVQGYCCEVHSLGAPADEIVSVIVGSAQSWRSRLEELARMFTELRAEACNDSVSAAVSKAATRLLPLVLTWTHAEDAWYQTFAVILGWYVEPLVPDPTSARRVIDVTVSGKFESWIEPSEDVSRGVIERLGTELETQSAETSKPDALQDWIATRRTVKWRSSRHCKPTQVERDGHRRYIDRIDAARDPARAGRLHAALDQVRKDAHNHAPLTYQRLEEWQSVVLGESAAFRKAPAYAQGGEQRYGLDDKTQRRFEACLQEANATDVHAASRAARVYLDVCFFHPFDDGNARAARLALDFVLSRAGLALHAAEPVFRVARRSGDPIGASHLQYVVDFLAGAVHADARVADP